MWKLFKPKRELNVELFMDPEFIDQKDGNVHKSVYIVAALIDKLKKEHGFTHARFNITLETRYR